MTNREETLIKGIRARYEAKETTKLDELKALDKRVNTPAHVFAYVFGTVGALILGVGMCLAMQVIGTTIAYSTYIGVGVGLLGILLASINYPAYKSILNRRKKKYANQINILSNELLNNN